MIISIAVIVLISVVAYYEAGIRNIHRINSEILENQLHMLNHEIYIRDTTIAEMAAQNNLLYNDLAATQEKKAYINTNLQEREEMYQHLYRRFLHLRYQYWEMGTGRNLMWWLGIQEMYTSLVTHTTTNQGKIDMIIRHFNAMYSGDLDAYLSTVQGGHNWVYPGFNPETDDDDNWTWVDWMLGTFRHRAEREYYRMEVKFIPDWPYSPERGRSTGGHLMVWILVQETPESEPFLRVYPLGVTPRGGPNWNEWRVYDYH